MGGGTSLRGPTRAMLVTAREAKLEYVNSRSLGSVFRNAAVSQVPQRPQHSPAMRSRRLFRIGR